MVSLTTNALPEKLQNNLIKNMYESGCYFLCLVHIAEKENTYLAVDVVRFAIECISNGWLKKDFTVVRPDLILGKLLEKTVTVTVIDEKDKKSFDKLSHKAIINCWYNKRTGFTHFNCDDWDSLENSVTVKEGKIASYRVFSW